MSNSKNTTIATKDRVPLVQLYHLKKNLIKITHLISTHIYVVVEQVKSECACKWNRKCSGPKTSDSVIIYFIMNSYVYVVLYFYTVFEFDLETRIQTF